MSAYLLNLNTQLLILSLLLVTLSLLKTILKQSWTTCLMTTTPSSPPLPQDYTHTQLKILNLFFWLLKNCLSTEHLIQSHNTFVSFRFCSYNKQGSEQSCSSSSKPPQRSSLNTHIIPRIHCCLFLLFSIFPKSCVRYARNWVLASQYDYRTK